MIRGVLGCSRYLISMVTASDEPRVLSSLARPRRSQARRSPNSKHSARKAKTSKTVDLPLPLGPSSTVSGVIFLNSTLRSARKFRTFRFSTRGGEPVAGRFTIPDCGGGRAHWCSDRDGAHTGACRSSRLGGSLPVLPGIRTFRCPGEHQGCRACLPSLPHGSRLDPLTHASHRSPASNVRRWAGGGRCPTAPVADADVLVVLIRSSPGRVRRRRRCSRLLGRCRPRW